MLFGAVLLSGLVQNVVQNILMAGSFTVEGARVSERETERENSVFLFGLFGFPQKYEKYPLVTVHWSEPGQRAPHSEVTRHLTPA